jgi:hypothetical protein
MSDHMEWRDLNSLGSPHSLNSNFIFPRRPRPPSNVSDSNEHVVFSPAPSSLPRRESKSGLRSFFTRMKTNSDLNHASTVVEEPVQPVSSKGGFLPSESMKTPLEQPSSDLNRGHDTPATTRRSAERSFMIRTGSKSTRTIKPVLKYSPKSSPKLVSKPARRDSATWDPPPLFQAYPQAIKHAQLTASTLSADSILRISNHKRNGSLRDDIAQTSLGADEPNKKSEKARNKHRRHISGSISKADWTQKIYVLVTSGYLLQYAGEGSFDRLPEKMMQLGKDSVAFASDVIPGKHWVLQISQAMGANGAPSPDSRSLFSRLAFRGADYRRATTSFLLVLDSAEELESWIMTVRREIEALGGQKYTSETGKPRPYDKVMHLDAQPSHRHIIQGNLGKSSNAPSPRTEPPWEQFSNQGQSLRDSVTESSSRSIESSREGLSMGTSLESQDLQQLESLRENSFRLSYVSSGQRTLLTSQGSSPACSPTHETFDKSKSGDILEEARPRPNAIAINERRRSMQTMQIIAYDCHATPKQLRPRPHSTFVSPGKPLPQLPQLLPRQTQNFSVPHVASKRYQAKTPSGNPVTPSVQGNAYGGQEVTMRGGRKTPPAPLNMRQLSPVRDQPSPVPQPLPERSSLTKIMPHFQSSSPLPVSPSLLNHRRSGILQNEQNVPRHHSSLQAHPDVGIDKHKFASGIASLQPASPRGMPSPSPSRTTRQTPPFHPPPRATPIPRRLTSMQFHTNSGSDIKSHVPDFAIRATQLPYSDLSSQTSKSMNSFPAFHSPVPVEPLVTPPSSSKPILPSVKNLIAQSNSQTLGNRRSMPLLTEGPPPAPPPNCALPPLPVSGVTRAKQSPLINNSRIRNGVWV